MASLLFHVVSTHPTSERGRLNAHGALRGSVEVGEPATAA